MLNKVVNDLFTQVTLPNWKKSSSLSISPRLWHKIFVKVAKDTNIISIDLASSLSSTPSLLRTMLNSFNADRTFPSAKEFAINIAFEISQPDFNLSLHEIPELWRLRFFASALRTQWLETIDNSMVLRSRFQTVFKSNPLDLRLLENDCLPELDALLCNRDKLTKAYFSLYNTKNINNNIEVWLPDNQGVIATSFADKVTVSITIDPDKGADLGFFRYGYEYSTYINGNVQWLQEINIDQYQALESAKFTRTPLNHANKDISYDREIQKIA